ncbi:dethiobiotin synthase [Halalkalibacterium ligniniphilum]|uniref:dethiobiotin synthase n=1 Tax=Halalkalibacterium ligniniphilum TaxID=1134413 RepID=UPI000347FF5E|nr:dethiobiotin synthase [Halalkalibacterium ligniniphilum]
MPKGLFITGTDTEVGKTIVAASLAAYFQNQGCDIGVFKPMMSGLKREDPNSDASLLKKMSKDSSSLKEINPFQFDEPLAPYIAAKRQGISISMEEVEQAWKEINHKHEFFLVEGAGGFMAPMGASYYTGHVAKMIDFPLVIVARPGLGTVNHTLLTIEAARNMGLTVNGVIINGLHEEKKSIAEETNPRLIEEFGHVPVLGTLPWMDQIERKTMIEMVGKRLSINGLITQ